jgi:cell wall-associated NlpC family hydrolase
MSGNLTQPDHSAHARTTWLIRGNSARRLLVRMVVVIVTISGTLLSAQSAYAYTDVTSTYWDYTAITYVATTNTWMRDYGSTYFKPTTIEIRKFLARALVKTFAPTATVDTTITFTDLPATDPFYVYANIATKKGWLPKFAGGYWYPNSTIKTRDLDRALVRALGLSAAVYGLSHIHQANGAQYSQGTWFPFLQLGRFLGLHYNHSDNTFDVQSGTALRRDEVAYSLWRAKTLPSWKLAATAIFDDVTLPTLDPTNAVQAVQQKLTQYALLQVGYPYIYAGEWYRASPSGYCCGYQPQGGFDCSGFVWWVMKRYEDGYNAAQFRSYPGWSIHQRSSSTMAQYTTTKISFAGLRIGDLMFFSSNGGTTYSDVDHVGTYIGNGWMMHSTSSNDGTVLEWVGNSGSPTYYYNHFVYGRRLG